MVHKDRTAFFWYLLITAIQKTSITAHYEKALAQEDGLVSKSRSYPTVQEGLVTEVGAQECTDCMYQCSMTWHSGSLSWSQDPVL